MFYNLLSSTYAIDKVEDYLIYGTIAIFGALFLAGIILAIISKVKKNGLFAKYLKIAGISFLIYALIIGLSALIMEIVKHYDSAYLEENYVSADIISYVFVPALVSVVLFLVSAITLVIINKYKANKLKLIGIILGAICTASVIATVVLIAIYYTNNILDTSYYYEYGKLNSTMLYVSAGVLLVVVIALAFILDKDKSGFNTRSITLAGICIAMSFCLSYVKFIKLPQGGSITLVSMLPIMLFAYLYGPKKGLLIGFIYGTLQAVQDPFIVHPAQFLLDYSVGYTMVGFAGVFKLKTLNKLPQIQFVLGATLAGILRFASQTLSGVFAFGAYAFDAGATNLWAYSLAYNSYVLADVLIVAVVGCVLLSSKTVVQEMYKYATASKEKNGSNKEK